MRPCLTNRYFASTVSTRPRSPMPRIDSARSTTDIKPPRHVYSRNANPLSQSTLCITRVPGWPSQLPAGSIQSPYVHRANGLAQIAVSTMLRTRSIANRKSQHAEHCRYGTRDLALTDMLSVCHPKTRARPLACWRAEGVEQVQGDVPRSRAEFRGDRTEVHASLWRKTDLPARLLEDLNPRGCRSSAACGNAVPRHAEVLPLGRKQRRRIPL